MDTQDIFKRNVEYHQKEKAAQKVDEALDAYEVEMISGINAHRAARAALALSRDERIAERVAAATFCLGGGVFPASYIFRLYFPIENESED